MNGVDAMHRRRRGPGCEIARWRVLRGRSAGALPTCLGQPVVGARECVGWWEPSRVKGGRQILVRLSGESPST
jgi:hypothetical protein